MSKAPYKIDGPAGVKYSCSVPQKVHQFPGLGINHVNVDKMTVEEADQLFEKTKDFLVLNPKPEAATGAAAKKEETKK